MISTSDFSYNYIITESSKNCTEFRKTVIDRLVNYVKIVGVNYFNTANKNNTLPYDVQCDVEFLVTIFYLKCMLTLDEEESDNDIDSDINSFNTISAYIADHSLNEFETNLYSIKNLPSNVQAAVNGYLNPKKSDFLLRLYDDAYNCCKTCTSHDCNNPYCRAISKLFAYIRKDKQAFEREFQSCNLPEDINFCLNVYTTLIDPDLTHDVYFND